MQETTFVAAFNTKKTAQKRNKYRKRFWVRPILQRRKEQGEYANLIKEMQLGDHESFFKYFRISPTLFEALLNLVAPLIIKSNQKESQSLLQNDFQLL